MCSVHPNDKTLDFWFDVYVETQERYSAGSLTLAVQDGPDSGQTVPHVHVHVLPRRAGDFADNDDVYDKLERHDRDDDDRPGTAPDPGTDERRQRRWRTDAEMAEDAAVMRTFFRSSTPPPSGSGNKG